MLFVPRQVALAAASPASAAAAAAMAKAEPKKEKKSKSKAAATAKGSSSSAAAAAYEARAAVVASVAAFLEAAGFPRALAALQSEANLEAGAWRSSPVSLEDLVAKFLESSNSAPVAAVAGSNEQDKAAESAPEDAGKKNKGGDNEVNASSAPQEDKATEKKKKKDRKKGGAEACEPESKVIQPSENADGEAKEKEHKKKTDDSSVENAGSVEAQETVKSDDQKVDGKKKKKKRHEKDDDAEARLEKVELAVKNKFEAAEKLKEDVSKAKEEEPKSQSDSVDKNGLGDGAMEKTKKKKKSKSAVETSEKTDTEAVPADGAKGKSDAVDAVKGDNERKAKKKRKKSESEENDQVEGKEVVGKGAAPKPDDENKNGMEIEEGENGKPSSENAVGKKRKLDEAEGSEPPAKENGTANQTLGNGLSEDKENSTLLRPSKRQKQSTEAVLKERNRNLAGAGERIRLSRVGVDILAEGGEFARQVPKTVNAFQRVKLENVKFADERLQDNSYWAKGGAESGYGAKAQEILGQVRGRGFRHEKTKKKRGTYRGGQIDFQTHSIKFDSDNE
ncbi:hypothetical protein ACP4OV_022958 [Aristida adscensionis]